MGKKTGIIYQSLSQAVKAILHSQHPVALQDPNPDSCTYCSIHSGTRSSHIHYGYVDVTLAWICIGRFL